MLIYSVIPARSGSKGFPHKNIQKINHNELISYSINHAKKIQSVSRVFISSDSQEYVEIGKKYGAEAPFLRSEYAASDTAMEEDILKDLRINFKKHNIDEPDLLVWLRPTFIFRNIDHIEECIQALVCNIDYTSARTVVESECRLYQVNNNQLISTFDDQGRSMIRRQELGSHYKVFSTDIIRFKGNDFSNDFLGRKCFAKITDKICGLDIDDEFDFTLVKSLVESNAEVCQDYV